MARCLVVAVGTAVSTSSVGPTVHARARGGLTTRTATTTTTTTAVVASSRWEVGGARRSRGSTSGGGSNMSVRHKIH
jgi:hypothetical protein